METTRRELTSELRSMAWVVLGKLQLIIMTNFVANEFRKSQIAINYAYWVQDNFPDTSVFWIHAANADRFHQAMSLIGDQRKIAGFDDPTADKSKLVKEWLESTHSGRWLLIIDNADDSHIFFKAAEGEPQSLHYTDDQAVKPLLGRYIPACSHGSILITTRNKQAGVKLTGNRGMIEVVELDPEKSIDLFRRRITDTVMDDDRIVVLAEQLGNLPLALVQAAAYIQECSLSINDYLYILKTSEDIAVKLLSQPFEEMGRDSDTPNAVTATWIISFEQIKQQHPRAADLLSLMSFFDRQDIPKAFLRRSEEDIFESEKALGVLKAFSFITASNRGQSFDMHRLVQLVMRKWLKAEGTAERYATHALKTVNDMFPDPKYENWKTCGTYLPHSYAVLDFSKEETKVRVDLQYNTGVYLWWQGRMEDAEKLLVASLKSATELLAPEHPCTLETTNMVAVTCHFRGQANQAARLIEQVWDVRKRVLGFEHSDTLSSMSNLASIYCELGRLNEAEQLLEQVLDVRKRVMG